MTTQQPDPLVGENVSGKIGQANGFEGIPERKWTGFACGFESEEIKLRTAIDPDRRRNCCA